ncbi:MAG: hypothetical protein N4A31_01825 [Rickettsiales bacterium]|jgi:hypothetical protein|nr:hypothetical protein [Rickettsiales bacterium]
MKKTFLKTTAILTTSAAFLTLASLSYAAPKIAHAAVASGHVTTQPTTPVGGVVHKAAHAKNAEVDPQQQGEEAASTNGMVFSQESTKIKQEPGQVTTQTSAAIESSSSPERSQSRR